MQTLDCDPLVAYLMQRIEKIPNVYYLQIVYDNTVCKNA